MDYILTDLRIPIESYSPDAWRQAASGKMGLGTKDIELIKILFKALDTSSPDQFYYVLSVAVSVPPGYINNRNLPLYAPAGGMDMPSVTLKERPIVIGFGPAGMFAALELIEYGLRPVIFERGRKIEERSADVLRFITCKSLDTESNIQFGEGGAGAYSDGKLFARAHNSAYADKVLNTFIKFGASPEIAYVAKPHVGTDVLCSIVRNIRNYVLERGGEINYGAKMTDLLLADGKASGVVINGRQEYFSSHIYIAVGHSAHDTFELLHKKGAALERRGVSIGVRIEHPAETINLIRYGVKYRAFPGLEAAVYSYNYTNRKIGRGAYTFCMCPGGEVVNASSENGLLVVNGMSNSARAGRFSNGAIVVTCHESDYTAAGPLAGMEFQKSIERKAFKAGGGNWAVPAQNLEDFLKDRASGSVNDNSCRIGTAAADMREIFPKFIIDELLTAFASWKAADPLFVAGPAVLLAPETRTSCPVKVLRGANYESVNIRNLYPIGEGAGYAGGITSSAIDAIRGVEYSLR